MRERVTTAGMEALRSGGYALDAAEKAVNVSEADYRRGTLRRQRSGRRRRDRAIERHGGRPMFNFKLVALNKSGEYGCCAIRGRLDDTRFVGQGFFVHDRRGARLEQGRGLMPPLTDEELAKLPWR